MVQIWLQSFYRRGKESETHRHTSLKCILDIIIDALVSKVLPEVLEIDIDIGKKQTEKN